MNYQKLLNEYGEKRAFRMWGDWILRTMTPERREQLRVERQDGYRQGR